MIRKMVVVSIASLLMAGATVAVGAPAPQSSSQDKALADQVSSTREKLDERKQQTEKLRRKVDDLQSRNQATESELKKSDETIAELREHIEELRNADGADDGAAAGPR